VTLLRSLQLVQLHDSEHVAPTVGRGNIARPNATWFKYVSIKPNTPLAPVSPLIARSASVHRGVVSVCEHTGGSRQLAEHCASLHTSVPAMGLSKPKRVHSVVPSGSGETPSQLAAPEHGLQTVLVSRSLQPCPL